MNYSKIVAVTNRHICYEKHIEELSPEVTDKLLVSFPMLKKVSENESASCILLINQLQQLVALELPAIILREKDLSPTDYMLLAEASLSLCNNSNTRLILHSFIDVAMELHAPYLHLTLHQLRKLKNASAFQEEKCISYLNRLEEIGVSIHSTDEALLAEKLGATYITAGHVFDTDCKKGFPGRGLSFLSQICNSVSIPVYGIGGISAHNFEDVLSTGAAGGCIMSGLM
ncbi:MAG: thiamine phosphate synthase [Wujia sp.]